MISACEKNGVQFMDGVMWTHHKRTALMKEHFNQLGDVRKVNGCFTVDDLPTDNIRLSKVLLLSQGIISYICMKL